jgi:hypothetical protein
MKCATTSLHYYLNLHPEISMSKKRELRFFVQERSWFRGLDWYCSHFNFNTPICGESSTSYSKYPQFEGVPERIYRVIPQVKLVYSVRDPIDRLVSQYVHHVANGEERRPFDVVCADLNVQNKYVANSLYHWQMTQYLKYFAPENILVLVTEQLQAQPEVVLAHLFRFLGVDPTFYAPAFQKRKHTIREKRKLNKLGQRITRSSEEYLNPHAPGVQRYLVRQLCWPLSRPLEKPTVEAEVRQRLQAYFYADVQKLKKWVGSEALNQWWPTAGA